MSPLQPVFGARVRLARKRLGLTQVAAARRVGLVPEAYGRIERGQALLRVSTLRQLCHALSVSADELLQVVRTLDAASTGHHAQRPEASRVDTSSSR